MIRHVYIYIKLFFAIVHSKGDIEGPQTVYGWFEPSMTTTCVVPKSFSSLRALHDAASYLDTDRFSLVFPWKQ